MGRHLSDDIIHRIKLHIEASEDVTTIAKAVRVSRKTICNKRTHRTIQTVATARLEVSLHYS